MLILVFVRMRLMPKIEQNKCRLESPLVRAE